MSLRRLACVAILVPVAAAAQNKTWTVNADWNGGALSQVADTPSDQLQLGPTAVTTASEVWACHTANAMVVRLDTKTGKQLGRYDSALQFVNGQPTGAQPEFGNNWPRRVAVDTNGDAWIPNAAFGNLLQGTLTKFSGNISHCIDRNHNGKIDTSVDANGDGVINTFDPTEFFGQNDECIITTIPVGAPGAFLRGVAIDRHGKVWVSENQCNAGPCRVFRFNPAEPLTLEATLPVKGNPYSLATGGQYLFVGNSGGGLATRIDIDSLVVQYLDGTNGSATCPANFYGALAGDPSGDRAYFGSYAGGFTIADWAKNSCTSIPGPSVVYTVAMDQQGNIWGANISGNTILKMTNGVVVGSYPLPGTAHGISADFNGFVWFSGYSLHNMYKVDPSNGAVVGSYSYDGPQGGPGIDYTSYLYSDFTGYQINRQAPFQHFGNWSAVFDGGVNQIPWSKVVYNVEGQGAVPAGTTLKLYARASDDMVMLPTIGYTPVVNGAALGGAIVGRFAQIEADFTGPGFATAVLSDVTLDGPCNLRGDACCLASSDCDDGNACTGDACPQPGAACTHAKMNSCCNVNADCSTGNLCSIDTCSGMGGTCTHTPKGNCCNMAADCGDGNLCTRDVCSGAGGSCSNPPIGGCCNANADCASGDACSIDLCSGPGGACSHFAKANCCKVDGDCDDSDACTTDRCPNAGGACDHAAVQGCCNADADCDDGNACTGDSCSGPGGACSHAAVGGCCNANADCDDKDACTADVCSGPGGACAHTAINGCCNAAADCDDQNLCTKDSCSGAGGSCTNAPVDGCCNVDADCDKHDVCSVDKCSGAGGTCSHSPKGSGCCTVDGDCDDKDVCTADSCAMGATCNHGALPGCCHLDGDCPNGFCVDHTCQSMPATGDGGGPNIATTGGCGCSLGAAAPTGNGAPLLLAFALFGIALRRYRLGKR